MIRPNKVSEIRSIGSSTCPRGLSETSDIESNARWLNLQGKFTDYFGGPSRLSTQSRRRAQFECRSTIEPSDFMFAAIGAQ
jgi:hypothetical protein